MTSKIVLSIGVNAAEEPTGIIMYVTTMEDVVQAMVILSVSEAALLCEKIGNVMDRILDYRETKEMEREFVENTDTENME